MGQPQCVRGLRLPVSLDQDRLFEPSICPRPHRRFYPIACFYGERVLSKKARPIAAETLRELYCVQGLSMDKIAERTGLPHSNVEYWMEKHKIARRPLRKYARLPFSGNDCEKAYMIGFRQGNLHALREGLGVRISTTTTHPAQIDLFRRIFGKYGHVYVGPVYNKDLEQYSWQIAVALDDSFSFLLPKLNHLPRWIKRSSKTSLALAAGFFDAEGHITVAFRARRGKKVMEVTIAISNSNKEMLQEIALVLKTYHPRIHLAIPKGTPVGQAKRLTDKDHWRLAVCRRTAQEKLLVELPLRHQEKVDKACIALSVLKGCDWDEARARIEDLWRRIECEVSSLAELGAWRMANKNTSFSPI